MKLECLIIGMGVFGKSLAKNLKEEGHTVIGVDSDDKALKDSERYLDQGIRTDVNNEDNLRVIGIDNFDYIFVTIGVNMQASLITTLHLSNLGARKIIARSNSPEHSLMLQRLGANRVVTPEIEIGERLAEEISSNFEKYIKFSDNFAMVQVEIPSEMVGRSLAEINLRQKFKLNVLSVKRNEAYIDGQGDETVLKDLEIIPDPNYRFKKFDRIYIVGNIKNIKRFIETYSGQDENAS